MFSITESAYRILAEKLEEERQSPDEELFLRLSMGIG